LKKIYLSYRSGERWVKEAEKSDRQSPARVTVRATFDQVSEHIYTKLAEHGLTQPFAATLITAFSLNNTGTPQPQKDSTTSAAASTTDTGAQADAAGFVAFESMHFFNAPGRHLDIGVAGLLGFRPTLALISPSTDGATATATSAVAQYQQAFTWGVWAEPNIRIADLAELTPFAGLGQTILTSSTTLIENGLNSQVGLVATNGAQKGAIFAESGIRLNIYSQSLEILHLNKGMLTPTFGIAAGLRRDYRFSPSGILAQAHNPQQRMFFRLSTDAIPLQDPARADQTFTLNFALEYERPWTNSGPVIVPSGTRFLIRGDLNLFKATRESK